MGALMSRWRKKATTVQLLEQLDKDISHLEGIRQGNLESQRRIIGSLVLYSVLTYITGAIIFYLYCMPESRSDKLLYSTPLLIFPILIYLIKRFLHWYFVKRISKNELALEELKKKKRTVLDEVMEKETYKVAKEILDRFDPDRNQEKTQLEQTPAVSRAPDGQELRKRKGATTPHPPAVQGVTPATKDASTPAPTSAGRPAPVPTPYTRNGQPRTGTPGYGPPGPPMPRALLPRERGTAERLLEMFLGDGPQNRYALICAECKSHNGMALREEFEYINFRCCYCFHLNPSRKQKPRAPRLNFSPRASIDRTQLQHRRADEKSKLDASDDSDASESKPKVIREPEKTEERKD